MSVPRRQVFENIISLPDAEIPLAEAALLVACEEYPHLALNSYLNQLDQMANDVRAYQKVGDTQFDTLTKINRVLFKDYGFSGNTANYYDPRNSFLNDVIERRLGIPITLSAIYIEVARRLHLQVDGVGLPGHFMLKHRSDDQDIFIDSFNGGILMTREECLEFVTRTHGADKVNAKQFMNGVSTRQIVSRMLRNLKMIYIEAEAFEKALVMVELMVLTDSTEELLYRDRGLLRLHLRQFDGAIRDLKRYVRTRPLAEDRKNIEKYLKELYRLRVMMN